MRLWKSREGTETCCPCWVSEGLIKYLEHDEYGWYKRAGAKIPCFHKSEYKRLKRRREKAIENVFSLELFDSSDKISKEELLRMG